MEGDEHHSHGCLLRDRCAQHYFAAPRRNPHRVIIADAVDLRVGGVDLDPRFGIGFVEHRIARHRAAVPVLKHASRSEDEGILVVGLFHNMDVVERDELARPAREGICEERRGAGMVEIGHGVDQTYFLNTIVVDACVICIDARHLAQDFLRREIIPLRGGTPQA